MSDSFQTKLHSAVISGWWTLLVAAVILLIQWILYLLVVPAQPHWVLTLWGPGANWEQVRSIWFWFLAGFKITLLALAFLLLWLTLWARQMRKSSATL